MAISNTLLRRLGMGLLSLCLVLFIWQQVGMLNSAPLFPVDDAYISLQNAAELLGEKSSFRFNESLTGATSITHTLIVAVFIALSQNDLLGLSLAAFFGAWLYLLGMTELTRCYTRDIYIELAVLFTAAFAALNPHQLSNGLETSWAMAAVAWSLCLYSRDSQRATRWLCVVLGAQPFIRPELIALSGSLGLLLVWRHAKCIASPDERRAYVLRLLGFSLLGALPLLALNFALTGGAVPNTVLAKKYYFSEFCADPGVKAASVASALRWLFIPSWLIIAGFLGLLLTQLGRVALLFVAVFYLSYWLHFPGALAHYEGRYQYILMPMALLGLINMLVWLRERPRSYWLPIGLLGVLVSVWINFSEGNALRIATETRAFTAEHSIPTGKWVVENVADDELVLVHDVGYVGYVGYVVNRPVLEDLVGLKTPSNIQYHREFTAPTCGLGRVDAMGAILLNSRPDYVVILRVWDQAFRISYAYESVGAKLSPVMDTGVYTVYQVDFPTEPLGTTMNTIKDIGAGTTEPSP